MTGYEDAPDGVSDEEMAACAKCDGSKRTADERRFLHAVLHRQSPPARQTP